VAKHTQASLEGDSGHSEGLQVRLLRGVVHGVVRGVAREVVGLEVGLGAEERHRGYVAVGSAGAASCAWDAAGIHDVGQAEDAVRQSLRHEKR